MSDPSFVLFSAIGVAAGGLLAVQSVLNAALAQRTGILFSMVILAVIGTGTLLLVLLLFPSVVNLQALPRHEQWYLYVGGFLGVAILAAPIVLVPRIGTASTLVSIVLGQLLLALAIDHFGFLGAPKITFTGVRLLGAIFAAFGALLVLK